jgi:cytochrome c6
MKKKLTNIIYCIFVSILLSFQNIKADDLFDQGKKIFLGDGNCASCHTLQDANSNANIGPNLNEIRPEVSRIISAVTNGIGVMPAYEGELSTIEIKAVATYVAKSTN